ncbi:MAG: CoB--CoM heterodisulfide reductase iron-sulfur subunit B family protein [Thermoplasmata archaeon]|nr:CoB--CoM heterodisulfide reductase iron-sulfur subunit B family protein [Thermoplasmata archaeon]
MEYAYFPGCTVSARSLNYDLSTRKIAETFGIELVDIEGLSCCGYPISSVHRDTAFVMAAKNICKAEEKGLDILTICSACTSVLTKVNKVLKNNDTERERINKVLESLGYEFKGKSKVKHFVRFLFEDVGPGNIENKIVNNLEGLRFAPVYGCHYLKPSDIYDEFDDPEDPKTLDQLIELTGGQAIGYESKFLCCGGALLGIDETTSMTMTKEILDDVKFSKADAIVLLCPFCSIMLDEYQDTIGDGFHVEYNLPTLYYTQLLGLAMGYKYKELGLNQNVVKTKKLIEKIVPE